MRILIVSPYSWNRPGGVRTHITDATLALFDLGHEVLVLSPVDGDPDLPDGWTLASERSDNVVNPVFFPVNTGKTLQFGGTQTDITWLNQNQSSQFVNLLKWFRPEIIHFHTPWTPCLSIQILRVAAHLREDGIIDSRFIATFHDTPSESGLGKLIGNYVMPFVARYFMRAFDEVIAVSKPQSTFLSRFTSQKVHVIPNGIRVPEFSEKTSNSLIKHKSTPFLLFLGRLEHRKGIFDAIEVFRQVSKSHAELTFIIAGDGPLRKDAEIRVNRYGLKNVVFLGRVSEADKWELMKRATIFLAPAVYGESFGIVLIEAMSVGTPVVGYANPGYKSVVSGHLDEQFVTPGDINKLHEIVNYLLHNPSQREAISEAGRKLSVRYSWQIVIQHILNLYLNR